MSEVKKNYDGPIESLESLQEEESSFNFKNMLSIFILNWKWFLLSMFIFVCGALIYLRYTDSVYQVTAKMLIKEETSNRRYNGSALASMQNLGMMTNSTGIENEMEILKSRRLSLEAINDLKLYVEYRTEGRIKKVLLYKTQPINVDLDPQSLERMNSEGPSSFGFIISRSSEGYRVVSDDMTALPFEGTFSTMPDTLTTPYGVLTFTLNISKGMRPLASGQNLLVSITAPKLVAQRYAKILQVEPTSKMTSIAQLIIRDLVESFGMHLSNYKQVGSICAISTIENIYDKYGLQNLTRTLRLIIGTWEGDVNSFSSSMLSAVARVVFTYDTDLVDEIFNGIFAVEDNIRRMSVIEGIQFIVFVLQDLVDRLPDLICEFRKVIHVFIVEELIQEHARNNHFLTGSI